MFINKVAANESEVWDGFIQTHNSESKMPAWKSPLITDLRKHWFIRSNLQPADSNLVLGENVIKMEIRFEISHFKYQLQLWDIIVSVCSSTAS